MSYKKRIRNRCSRRVNHYRICKLNYIVIIFFGSCFSSRIIIKFINLLSVYRGFFYTKLRIRIGNLRRCFRAHKFKRYAYISAEMVEVNRTVCAEQYLFPAAVSLLEIQIGFFFYQAVRSADSRTDSRVNYIAVSVESVFAVCVVFVVVVLSKPLIV